MCMAPTWPNAHGILSWFENENAQKLLSGNLGAPASAPGLLPLMSKWTNHDPPALVSFPSIDDSGTRFCAVTTARSSQQLQARL